MSFFQNGGPESFENYAPDQDHINRVFEESAGNGLHANTTMNGMSGFGGMSVPWNQDEEEDRDYHGEDVKDYTTEVPDEEGEGLAYNIEKRHIRETVDLADAYVFAWGDGKNGKLGQQSTDTLHVPYFVAALQKMPIRMCALGKQHTLFLTTEGYVLSCGSNSYGQLGTGEDTEMRSFPILIQTLSEIKSISSGHYHCLALSNNGKVHAWGSGSWGKLGLASDANQRSPRMIASIQSSMVESVSCGAHHSVAITATGDVWTWGKGARGQLGHNSVKEEYSPRLVAMLRKKGAERVRCGDDHTLVLLRNGMVLAMGANSHGQLGLGLHDLQDRGLPVQITSGSDGFEDEQFADMACCGNSSLLLSNTGKVYMFGDANSDANASLANFRIPQQIKFLPKGDPITAVGRSGTSCFAISDTGNLFRWTLANAVHADSGDGQELGTMEAMHAIRGVVRIYCGVDHMAVICTPDMGCTPGMITRDKATSFSTDVSKASLEKLPDDPPALPLQVIPEFLDDIAADTIMESPSREGDGYFLTYGKGVFGRLGHGMEYTRSEESTRFPKRVETLAKMTVAHIDCGKDSTAAITDTGKLYMWGKSVSGKLGLGPNQPQSVVVPRLVESLSSKVVVRVSLGRNHSACLTDEHRFFTWGSNTFGQLGIPSITTSLNHPEEISSLREANIRHFACGGWHTIVCAWNGWVLTCGKGWHGQLGQGDYESLTARAKTLPYFKRISDGFGDHIILKVYGGKEVSAALSEAGRVFTWGQGDQCQLGHDSTNNEQTPRELEALSRIRIVDLALGESHMLALDEMGVPYSWGKGANGQLGHGELGEKQRTPRAIELCRRVTKSSSGFDNITKDIKWGSFFFQKTRASEDEEEKENIFFQRGKVVMIAAEGNYSMFVLERKANKMEIKVYDEAVKRNHNLQKKMTEETVIRELFGCGAGKGGVLQNVGKENEYLPKLLPDTDEGNLLQDIIQVSAGKAHVGVLIREDPLRNVEANNMKNMIECNERSNRDRKINEGKEKNAMLNENALKSDDVEEEEDMSGQNPFAMEVDENLKAYLESIPVFDAQKWFQRLKEADVDLETLSSLRTDEDLKKCNISAIGARRRLLKEIEKLPNSYPPVFYAYKNSDFFYISWPPNRASDIAAMRKKARINKGGNVFEPFMAKKASGKIFRCLVRYAETKHFESISERANLRYQVTAEGSHRLFTWGTGLHGRLGHGYGISFAQPKEVTTLPSNSKVVEVACGCEHTILRTYDGAVLSMGNGERGQLGVTENFHGVGINILMVPQQISGLKRFFIVQIAAGRWHNMALTSDRLVYVWGAGHFGQLGLDASGADSSKGTPVPLKCLDGRAVCKLLCGGWHSAAINESGKMFAWGKNTHGQLGLGDEKSTNYPKIITALRLTGRVRTAALGANHTVVVMVENRVFAFGAGDSGQIGINDGHRKDQWTPVQIESLENKNIFQVAAGDIHSMALSVFGEVWAWGGSPYGQLGHGGIMEVLRPMPLLERHNIPTNVKSIAAGYTFSMAVTQDGEVFSWGQGEAGELGHAPKVLVYAPMAITEFTNVMQLSCGHRHAAAIQFTARMSHMDEVGIGGGGGGVGGDASSVGQSGKVSGTTSPRSASTHTKSYAQSGLHSAVQTALTNSGTKKGYAYLWGEDSCGQLGMRGLQAARSPTLLQGLSGLSIVHVAANSDISAYVTDTGSVYVSGSGDEGRLGLGHLAPAPTPLEVTSIKQHKIIKIACGQGHTVVLSDDRKVYAWGEGTWGNCGVANSSEVLEPQEMHSLTSADAVNIFCGGFHSAAITLDGSLYTWGKNANGQLGQGTVTMAEESPRKVESIGAIIGEVALGRNHTAIMAQVSSPNLYTCGMNANGQLGHDDFVDRCDPTAVSALDDRQIVSVGAGSAHTACVSQFGDLITFGNGRSGQLGVLSGVDADQPSPVQLPGFSRNQLQKVVCGQELTGVITDHGEVFLCGRESSLGLGGASGTNLSQPMMPKEVEGLSNVAQLALGSAHAIGLTFSSVDTGPEKK